MYKCLHLINTNAWMLSLKIKHHIFLQNVSSRLRLYLYFQFTSTPSTIKQSAKHYDTRTKHTISFLSDTRLGFTCTTCCFFTLKPWYLTIWINSKSSYLPNLTGAYIHCQTRQFDDRADNLLRQRSNPHCLPNSTFTTEAQLCRLRTGAQNTAQTPPPAHRNHLSSSQLSVFYAVSNHTNF